ncbi:hypothetical protein LCGC14_0390580 [marine sediment metagenome]|uniref:Uncharacterized protein n=1 Tax=marine sediment metagenome TaxID=412755 RepID=A0A0F9W8Q0_9ZZZZ
MARQVLPTLDLRTSAEREGITKTQQTVRAIAGILETVGRAEKARRDSETLDRVARALSSGATNIEAIAGQEPSFGGGLQGVLQKVSGAFQPEGSMRESILQSIIGQKLKQTLNPPLLTRDEEREKALFGIRDRPGAPTVKAPTKQQSQRDRDLATIENKNKSDFQKDEARKRLDKDPSQPRKPVPSGGTYDEFLNDEDKVKGKFGKEAYEATLKIVKDEARLQGMDPKQVKQDFDRWWDARVKEERTSFIGPGIFEKNITTPRAEFQSETPTPGLEQNAPRPELGPFWDDLSEEEKKEIIQRLDEDPNNIKAILRILERG